MGNFKNFISDVSNPLDRIKPGKEKQLEEAKVKIERKHKLVRTFVKKADQLPSLSIKWAERLKAPTSLGLGIAVAVGLAVIYSSYFQVLPSLMPLIEEGSVMEVGLVKRRAEIILAGSSFLLPLSLFLFRKKEKDWREKVEKAEKMEKMMSMGAKSGSVKDEVGELKKQRTKNLRLLGDIVKLLVGASVGMFVYNMIWSVYHLTA